MNNSSRKGFDSDIRSLLKNQHKKVYSICRLFANNYKEHQHLFTNIIAAASQNIRSRRDNGDCDKQTLVLRACINMAALHSITEALAPVTERLVQFKSPDYQRSMSRFRESVGTASDYEKFRLFLEFEKVPMDELTHLTGLPLTAGRVGGKKKEAAAVPVSKRSFNFIPYIKAKLVWS